MSSVKTLCTFHHKHTYMYVCMYVCICMRVRVSMRIYFIRYGYQIYLKQLNITNLIIMAKSKKLLIA